MSVGSNPTVGFCVTFWFHVTPFSLRDASKLPVCLRHVANGKASVYSMWDAKSTNSNIMLQGTETLGSIPSVTLCSHTAINRNSLLNYNPVRADLDDTQQSLLY